MRLGQLKQGQVYRFVGTARLGVITVEGGFTFFVIKQGVMPVGILHIVGDSTVNDLVVQLLGYSPDGGSTMTKDGPSLFELGEPLDDSGIWVLYGAHAADPNSYNFKQPITPLISNPTITLFEDESPE